MTGASDLVVTPGVTGTDGIAFVSRLVVRALEPPSAGTAAVEVLSLDDSPGSEPVTRALGQVAVSGAAGRKLRFIALALRRALAGPRPSNIVCLHLRLSPVARLVARRAGTARRVPARHRSVEAARPPGAVGAPARGRPRGELRAHRATLSPGEPGILRAAHRRLSSRRERGRRRSVRFGRRTRRRGPVRPHRRAPGRLGAIQGSRCCSSTSGRGSWRGARRAPRRGRRRRRPRAPRSKGRRARPPTCGSSGACPIRRSTRCIDDCAFFVMPSRDEGFGLVFLEAMRAGKACIGGAGAAAEIIEDGVTGLVVDPTDTDEVAKAVVRLFLEPETRARMGRAGAERLGVPVHRSALSPPLPRHPRARRAVTAVLGISAYHGDAAAALVVDGRLVAAVEEERFARVKHWAGFPRESIRSCLAMAGLTPADVDHFAIGRNPRANLWRKARFALAASAEPRPRLGPRAQRPARASTRPRPSRRRSALDRARVDERAALGRAPSGASGQRVLRLAVRRGGRLRHRRLRRLRQHLVGRRSRGVARGARSRLLPALARPLLPRDHAVPRLHDATATSTR